MPFLFFFFFFETSMQTMKIIILLLKFIFKQFHRKIVLKSNCELDAKRKHHCINNVVHRKKLSQFKQEASNSFPTQHQNAIGANMWCKYHNSRQWCKYMMLTQKLKKIHWKAFAREFKGLIKSICTYNQIRAARDKLDIYVYQ